MSKAGKFIEDYTRSCSNELDYVGTTCKVYQPWLTPEQTLRAVEIEREEMIDKAEKWLRENKDHPFIGCEDPCLSGYLTDEFIEEFKQAMEK